MKLTEEKGAKCVVVEKARKAKQEKAKEKVRTKQKKSKEKSKTKPKMVEKEGDTKQKNSEVENGWQAKGGGRRQAEERSERWRDDVARNEQPCENTTRWQPHGLRSSILLGRACCVGWWK
jgi:hypothetical protein